jgi:hypothetical protein
MLALAALGVAESVAAVGFPLHRPRLLDAVAEYAGGRSSTAAPGRLRRWPGRTPFTWSVCRGRVRVRDTAGLGAALAVYERYRRPRAACDILASGRLTRGLPPQGTAPVGGEELAHQLDWHAEIG